MSDGADFIGRGILWPLRVDQSGSIALGSGPDDINASIRMAIMTAPGERVMRPQFGCRIWDLLFEPINANTLGLMGEAIRDTVSQWEPRVDLEDVAVEPDPASAVAGDDRPRATGSRRPTTAATSSSRSTSSHERSSHEPAGTEPRRPLVPGPRRRGQAPHPDVLPGVDEPQPDRPRRGAHRAVRLDDRAVAVPPQPGAGQVLHAHAEHDGLRALPGDGGADGPHVLARRRGRRTGLRAGRDRGQHVR